MRGPAAAGTLPAQLRPRHALWKTKRSVEACNRVHLACFAQLADSEVCLKLSHQSPTAFSVQQRASTKIYDLPSSVLSL